MTETAGGRATLSARIASLAPGVGLCLAIAAVATVIGRLVPILGSALPAVVIGVVLALRWRPGPVLGPGVRYSSKFLLQCAVVLLGTQLSLASIAQVGAQSLPVLLTSLAACLAGAFWIGRAMGVNGQLRTLIGVGTGICGASAIAAVAPVIGAASAQISYAISTIFLFNILAVVIFPLIGHLLDMGPDTFGLFAGTAVNDTSSVVAAASVYATSALGFAVVVKLVRTLMIIPISVVLAVRTARAEVDGGGGAEPGAQTGQGPAADGPRADGPGADRPKTGGPAAGGGPKAGGPGADRPKTGGPAAGGQRRGPTRLSVRGVIGLVPWFLVGFLAMAVLNTVVPLGASVQQGFTTASVFLITTALAGVGLSTDIGAIRHAGWRPLALGGVLWVLVTATTLLTMWATGWLA